MTTPLKCARPGCEAIHPNATAELPGLSKGWRCLKHDLPPPPPPNPRLPLAFQQAVERLERDRGPLSPGDAKRLREALCGLRDTTRAAFDLARSARLQAPYYFEALNGARKALGLFYEVFAADEPLGSDSTSAETREQAEGRFLATFDKLAQEAGEAVARGKLR